jgi:catechol 2,3-dioxygenase-like lactoylglutathione lyase family enzyme
MSSVDVSGESAAGTPPVKAGEFRLEVVLVPVSDVDRAKEFYEGLGWRLDADIAHGEDFRIVQFTPPGSACSIQFGTNIASDPPGSAHSLYLIVPDIEAARGELLARGADVSEVFHEGAPGARFHDSVGPTARSRPSAIRMATAGCSRRSRRGCPVAERRG